MAEQKELFFFYAETQPILDRKSAHPIKGGDYEVEDLDKAGLDLSQPQGALAEGQCGLGNIVGTTKANGGKVNKFDGLRGNSRIIIIGEHPREFVNTHRDMTVRTPSGNTVPLSDAYNKWGRTRVAVDDVPGLTEYLTTQPQLYNAWDEEMRQREADRYVDSISLTDPTSVNQMKNLAGTLGTAVGLGATAFGGAAVLPFVAPGTVGGTLIGEAAGGMAMGELLNKGSEILTGRNWGDNVRHALENTFEYNPESWSSLGQSAYNLATDMTNPGYWTGSKWLKTGIDTA